ncbi:MAG TPA: polysaccharide lyase [Thermoanaerobaculia bacterium]
MVPRKALAPLLMVSGLAVWTLPIASPAGSATPRPGVWFCGDFETGSLDGWLWDRPHGNSIQVVTQPVRRGRYAARVTLAPGDIAASKERAELKVGDQDLERVRGGQGGEMWYGWSVLIPADYADPPGDQFQILAQWHHRPAEGAQSGARARVSGPPPLTLHFTFYEGKHLLSLIGRPSPQTPRRTLAARPVRKGEWIDLIFHIRWSTGSDGFVEAWLDGQPFTTGKIYGPTLYRPVSNYLRIGLYRGRGIPTTNHVFIDEVRIGESYRAVAP